MKIHKSKLMLFLLVVSPLLSVTGSNDFSTSLNVASLLNLPSLNFLNYLFLLLFFGAFVVGNVAKTWTNLLFTLAFMVVIIAVMPRHFSFYAFLGVIALLSSFLVFMNDRSGLTDFTKQEFRLLYRIYWFYIAIGVIVHIYLVVRAGHYYANDRMMGIFKNPNQFGFFLVAFYILYAFTINTSLGIKGYVTFLVIAVLVVLTGSRSALMALLLIHIAYELLNRKWIYLTFLLLVGVIGGFIMLYVDSDKVLAAISRREASAVKDVGNMRLEIFKETWRSSTWDELIIGRDASIGTNGMIFEQRGQSGNIVWLDSLVSALLYNWGLVGLFAFIVITMFDVGTQIPYISRNSMIIVFYVVTSLFFVMGDYFPLPFLIVLLKNNLDGPK
jgi:hypothetical protein